MTLPMTDDRPPDPSTMEDPGWLADLYRQHAATIYRLAYRLTGSRDDAEDVVQDVFVGLPEAMRRYREQGRFTAWLHAVAARVALGRMRRRRGRREVTLDEAADAAVQPRTPQLDRAALERALDMLPPSLRTVFVLRELEGCSHAEIARLLGIGEGTSKVRLHRAWARLRQQLRSES